MTEVPHKGVALCLIIYLLIIVSILIGQKIWFDFRDLEERRLKISGFTLFKHLRF